MSQSECFDNIQEQGSRRGWGNAALRFGMAWQSTRLPSTVVTSFETSVTAVTTSITCLRLCQFGLECFKARLCTMSYLPADRNNVMNCCKSCIAVFRERWCSAHENKTEKTSQVWLFLWIPILWIALRRCHYVSCAHGPCVWRHFADVTVWCVTS